MGNDAKLSIVLEAVDKTEKAFNDVKDKLHENEKQTEKFSVSLATMAKVAAGAFAAVAGAVAISVKQYANAGDEIQKMAIRTGFSTESLSELRHAANLSGTSIGAMETAITRMSRTLTAADEESKGAQKSIERLGLSVDDLLQLSPEERFLQLAYAVAEIEDPALKTAAAMDVFGKQGTQLLPMLAEGKEGLDAMREEAHRLGIVFDEEGANKAARFNDQMERMQKAFQGIMFAVASFVIEPISNFIQLVIDGAVKIREFTEAIFGSEVSFSNIKEALDSTTGLVTLFKNTWETVVFLYEQQLKPALLELWDTLKPFKPLLDALIQVFGTALVIAIGTAILVLGALAMALVGALTMATKFYNFLIGSFSDAWDWITDKISASIDKIEAFISKIKEAFNMVGGLPKSIGGGIAKAFGVKSVDDAIISPRGDIITTNPRDYLIATTNPAGLMAGGNGGVTIYVDNFIGESEYVEKFGDKIARILKDNARL
jgi:hypothetical protein